MLNHREGTGFPPIRLKVHQSASSGGGSPTVVVSFLPYASAAVLSLVLGGRSSGAEGCESAQISLE